MGWRQVWLAHAKSNLRRLDLDEQTAICRAVEEFARDAADDEPPGHLKAGKWWVGLVFERGARYRDDDGEEAEGDVVWVMRLSTPDPNSDEEYDFEFEEDDEDEEGEP